MALRKTSLFFLSVALLVAKVTPVQAQEQVTLQLNGSGLSAADPQSRAINTWLDQANVTTGHATDANLAVQSVSSSGLSSALAERVLVQFDISRIPRSGIKSASLQLYLNSYIGTETNRQWEVDPITSYSAFPLAYAISWSNRSNQLSWTTPGGDFISSGNTVAVGTTVPTTLAWDVTSTVQTWFGGYPPSANYGFMIKDPRENLDTLGGTCNGTSVVGCDYGLIASNQDPTTSHRPALVVTFIQEVRSLTATPSSGSVVLNWSYPDPVANGTVVNATSGVVIVRNASAPVPNTSLFQDGLLFPSLCSNPNSSGAVVVYANATLSTTFTDAGGSCPPVDGTTYFYKVFAVAQTASGFNYSTNGNGTGSIATVDNSFVTEIAATPGVGTAAQAPVWIAPVQAASLGAPGVDPGNFVLATTNNSLVQAFNPANGNDAIAPISIGGAVTSRMPVLESDEADYGTQTGLGPQPMAYLVGADNLVYDIQMSGSGYARDYLNPVPVNGAFTGGIAIQAKAFSNSGNTKPNDVMIAGTHLAGANTTTNIIFAANTCNLSVNAPGNTGCSGTGGGGWTVQGGSGGVSSLACSATSTPATCMMDIITSTPLIDYAHNTVWVTTHNNNTSGTPNLPNLWKLDANTGAVLAAINLGGNLDTSPSLLPDNSAVLVARSTSVYVFDAVVTDAGPPVTPHLIASRSIPGIIKGFPVIVTNVSPYDIIVSTTNNRLFDLRYTPSTSSLSNPWGRGVCINVSGPLGVPGLTDTNGQLVVMLGCGDGKLYEYFVSTGLVDNTRIVDPAAGVIVGTPTLDVVSNKAIVGASDGRVYAFTFPF